MTTDDHTQAKRTWPRWVGLVLALLLLVYAILGFLVLPWWLERQLPEQAQRHLGWQAESSSVHANPFTLSVTVEGFSANDSGGESVARAEELHLNVSFLQLFVAQIGIDEFRLKEPYLRLEIGSEGDLNVLQDWRNNSPQATRSDQADADSDGSAGENGADSGSDSGFPLVIEDATLTAGKILLRDRRGGATQEFNISPLEFDLSGVATFENSGDAGSYYLSATLGDNQNLTWQGDISLMPLHSSGEIELENLAAESLWHFIGRDTPYDWRRGRVSLKSGYQVAGTEQLQLQLIDGEVGIRDSEFFLSPDAEGQPALMVEQLDAQGLSFDLAQMRLQAGAISASNWAVMASRSAEGTVNWVERSAENDSSEEDQDDSSNDDDESFSWRVEQLTLDSGKINWRDHALATPADIQLDQVKLDLTDLTGDPDSPVGISLELSGSGKGRAQLNGELTLNPFTLESGIQLTNLELANFQAYLNEAVNLDLTAGILGFDGNISLDDQEPELTGSVSGTLSADGVETQLEAPEAPFLSWTSLRLNPLRVQLKPLTVDIPEISWVDPEFTYVRLPEGDNSVARLTTDDGGGDAGSEEADTDAEGEEPENESDGPVGFALRIQRLNLENAAVAIDDRSIEGGFQTRLHTLNGTLLALGNQRPQRAEVSLQGELGDQGSLSLDGTIGALGQNDTTELQLAGENIAMPPFTPYVERYLGYVLESGRLELDLDYTLKGNEIDGSNDIVMHDFSLGEGVDSPDAVDAPVRLGIGLLRGRDGTIDIELPVNGDLSDPSFNFSEVIFNAFSGLVARAATAPFSILANIAGLGGSDEDIGRIGFAPGSAALPAREREELRALAEALSERPAITLAFRGLSAPDWDGPALVLAQRGVTLPSSGPGALIDALERQLVEREGEAALEEQVRARDENSGPRRSSSEWARTLLGQLAGDETPESGALRKLAEQRASAIHQVFVNNGTDPGRLTREDVRTDAEVESGFVIIPLEPDSR